MTMERTHILTTDCARTGQTSQNMLGRSVKYPGSKNTWVATVIMPWKTVNSIL